MPAALDGRHRQGRRRDVVRRQVVQAGVVDVGLFTLAGKPDNAHEREMRQEDQLLGQSRRAAQLPQVILSHHHSARDGQCQ